MKKYIIAAMLVMCSAQVVNAQNTVYEGNNVEGRNVADYEFSPDALATKYNYYHQLKKRGAYEDMKLVYEGNNLEPTILLTQKINTWYLEAVGVGGHMADEFTIGGGIGAGYEGRKWTVGARGVVQSAYEDVRSDVKAAFRQYRLEVRLGYKLIEWNAHHTGLEPFVAVTMQQSKFHDFTSVTQIDTQTDQTTGTTTTTTITESDLFVNEFTSGFCGGVNFFHHFKWSPLTFVAGVSYGVQQNIVLNTNLKYGQAGAYIGLRYRILQDRSYNHAALQRMGLSTYDVWNMRSDKPFQTKK